MELRLSIRLVVLRTYNNTMWREQGNLNRLRINKHTMTPFEAIGQIKYYSATPHPVHGASLLSVYLSVRLS